MRELDDLGLYRGDNVYVSRAQRRLEGEWHYQVIAGSHIEIQTTVLEIANGIAATLDALVPIGSDYRRENVLRSLAILTEGRFLLAAIVASEADTVRGLGDAVKDAAARLYGQRSR